MLRFSLPVLGDVAAALAIMRSLTKLYQGEGIGVGGAVALAQHLSALHGLRTLRLAMGRHGRTSMVTFDVKDDDVRVMAGALVDLTRLVTLRLSIKWFQRMPVLSGRTGAGVLAAAAGKMPELRRLDLGMHLTQEAKDELCEAQCWLDVRYDWCL